MLKIVLYAALMLSPLFAFADNWCEICGKDISQAKKARRCAVCSIREPVGTLIDCCKNKDKNLRQVLAERRVKRLGSVAIWNYVCLNQQFPVNIAEPLGERRLNCSNIFFVQEKPDRIRIVLKDANPTIIIPKGGKKYIQYRGVYVLDNVPLCLPGKNQMTLFVRRCAVDALECILAADDGSINSRRGARGIVQVGKSLDFSGFY